MPRSALIALAAGLALPATPVRAADACPNGLLSLAGTNRTVSPEGVCNAVEVSGSGNTVHVRLAPGATVGVSGTRNTVIWMPADPKGAPPAIHKAGTSNTVQRG